MLIPSLENISTNCARYINIAERCHWNTILSYRERGEKYIIAGPKLNRGRHAFIIQPFVRWLRVLVPCFYAAAEHGEISLLSCEHGCNVANKPISKSSHVRIKWNVWAIRHFRDYRLIHACFTWIHLVGNTIAICIF